MDIERLHKVKLMAKEEFDEAYEIINNGNDMRRDSLINYANGIRFVLDLLEE